MAIGVYRTLVFRNEPRLVCRAIRRTILERRCAAAGLVDQLLRNGDEEEKH